MHCSEWFHLESLKPKYQTIWSMGTFENIDFEPYPLV